jgi:hypothetical protein
MNNSVKQALSNNGQRKPVQSRITPIVRMGQPVVSKYTRFAEKISDPSLEMGYAKGGDIVAGLTSGLKGYLGMRGAMEDMRNQQAYNDNLAQIAEQERQDKLAQQAAEQDYKDRALAQDLQKAQMAIDATNARAELARQQALEDRKAQWEHDKEVYDLKRADAIADRDVQLQATLDAENRKRAYEEEQLPVKQLDPASQQQYFQMKQQGMQPEIIDNKVGWVGKIFGKPKYKISVSDALKKRSNYSAVEENIMNKGLK